MSFSAAELDRRMGASMGIGTVVAIDVGSGRARVSLGGLETTMIPVMQMRSGTVRMTWMPSIGEQVTVAAPDGDLARAFVMGSVPIDGNHVAPSQSEPTMDLGGGTLRIIGKVYIEGDVRIVGDVEIEGMLAVTETVTAEEDVLAAAISLKEHIHPESIGILTGVPQ